MWEWDRDQDQDWYNAKLQDTFERPSGAILPLTASGMEWWTDGIVPVKSWNGREPRGRRLCE